MQTGGLKYFLSLITFLIICCLIVFLIFGQNFLDEGKILITALLTSGYFFYLSLKRRFFLPQKFTLLYLAFLSLNIVSLSVSPSPYNSLLRLIELSSFLFLMLLSYNLFLKKRAKDIFPWLLITLASFISLASLYHYQNQSLDFSPYQSTQGPFFWPGLLASFLLLVLPFCFLGLLTERNKFLITLRFLLIIPIFLAFFLTKSFWTIIGLFILLVLTPLLFWQEFKKRLSIVFAVIFVVISLIYPLSQHNNVVLPSPQAVSFQSVIACHDLGDLRKASKAMFSAHPFFGNGPASFENIYRSYQGTPWSKSRFAFNEYSQILVENGVIGLISFISLIGYLFYLFLKRVGKSDSLTRAAFLGLFIFLFDNLNNFSARVLSLEVIFWALVGFYLSLSEVPPGTRLHLAKFWGNRFLKLFSFTLLLITSFLILNLSLFRLGQNYFLNKNDPQRARTVLSYLTRVSPLNHNYFIWMASIELDEGKMDEAIKELKKAQALEPKNAETAYQIGNLYRKMGKLEEARGYLEKAIRLSPFYSPSYYNALAEVYLDLVEKDKAWNIVKRAKEEIFPLNQKFWFCERYLKEENISTQLLTTYLLYQQLLK